MPRTERFGLGTKIDSLFLELLELLQKSMYANLFDKVSMLEKTIAATDALRFFLQLAWEMHLIPNNQYIALGGEIENIGRMLGGWRKGIVTKTSARGAEERKG